MKIIWNSDAERRLARGGRVDVCPYLAGKGAPIMVDGVRARGRLRDGPALLRRKESVGSNGECKNCGMHQLNLELPAQQFI